MKNFKISIHRFRWLSVLMVIGFIGSTGLLTYHGANILLAAGKVIYTCPMDPQIRQDSPGKCPICGMNLVKKEISESGKTSTANKIIYTCPMDPQIRQDTPGKCPICGMNLVKKEVAVTETKKRSPVPPKKTETNGETKYQCPMHPTIVQDHPGDCPICGMKLVKMKSSSSLNQETSGSAAGKGEDEVSGNDASVDNRVEVTIDPSRQQLIGLRTAQATRGNVGSDWQTVGRVQIDQTKVRKINIKVAGYVEKIFVDFVGKPVRRGEPLFTFYSPDLLSAQREYLLALKTSRAGGDPVNDSLLVDVVRQKLQLWDVSEDQIKQLEETGEVTKSMTFESPVSGVVTSKMIVAGSSLNPGDTPYEITDLSSVWVIADAYQSDAVRAKVGMSASVSLESLPDQVFTGTVAFIDPVIDPQSRTFKVRINIENTNDEFKPDMFADVILHGSEHETLTIPADAVIPTGRGSMVFVALGNGKFQPRVVKLGEKSGDRIEVKDGVHEGESVVMRANFLVDSESSLRAALAAVGGN